MKKHIIWDFNGTLLDDVGLAVWCDNQVLGDMGLPGISLDTYRKEMRVPMAEFYRALGVDLERYPYEEINRAFLRLFDENVGRAPLREGTLAALEALRQAGHGHSIVSASYEPTLLKQTRDLGLAPWMQRITGLQDTLAGHKKERADWHMRQLALDPEAVVLVGDTVGDAELAAHLGCGCILLEGGHVDAARLAGHGYPVAGSMAEIVLLLGQMG